MWQKGRWWGNNHDHEGEKDGILYNLMETGLNKTDLEASYSSVGVDGLPATTTNLRTDAVSMLASP